MTCCSSVNGTCVRTDHRDDRDWPPRPGREARFEPGVTLRQIAGALASTREGRADWEQALRFFNPTTFDECGSVVPEAPPSTYVPTAEEVRDLRLFGPADDPCSGPDDADEEPAPAGPERAAPELAWDPSVRLAYDGSGRLQVEPAREQPDALIELTGSSRRPDLASLPAEERASALRSLAVERGLEPGAVRWDPTIGLHVGLTGARPAAAPISIHEITPDVSNDELFGIIQRQGGLPGVDITSELRASPQYQQFMAEEHAILLSALVLQNLPTTRTPWSSPGSSPLRLALHGAGRLNGQLTDEQLVELAVRRSDERMTFALALERLGR
jgi:hypothetical protein